MEQETTLDKYLILRMQWVMLLIKMGLKDRPNIFKALMAKWLILKVKSD